MSRLKPNRLSIVSVVTLISFVSGCSLFTSQPRAQGQIVVEAVSWQLVKKYAEPDAGLPGHKVVVEKEEDHSVVAEKTTDATGIWYSMLPRENIWCSAPANSQ
jgi:hypothetical protein